MSHLTSEEYECLVRKTESLESRLFNLRREHVLAEILGYELINISDIQITELESEIKKNNQRIRNEHDCKMCGGFRYPTEPWKHNCGTKPISFLERCYNYWENSYDLYTMHMNDGCNGD